VTDNGLGFDMSRTHFTPEDHWGLANMQERADQIGADFRVVSAPGQGTEIEAVAHVRAVPQARAS
jgi:NarL family two-component system sensor histidine kinase LiaS